MKCVIYFLKSEGNSSVSVPGGLYLEGLILGGFLCLKFWELINEGVYFRNFMVWYRRGTIVTFVNPKIKTRMAWVHAEVVVTILKWFEHEISSLS